MRLTPCVIGLALLGGCFHDRALDYCPEQAPDLAPVVDMARDAQPDLSMPDLFDWRCPNPPTFIITVDAMDNMLARFRPDTLEFANLGVLSCKTRDKTATPFSMAVARDGTAWVLYSDGEVFTVDTASKTLICKNSGYVPGQQGYTTFGMAFSSNGLGSMDETLFVAPGNFMGNDTQLGSIDTTSLKLSLIAPLPLMPELTGTGDGRLWGFFPTGMGTPTVTEIDKKTALLTRVFPMPLLAGDPEDWAFATWAGDFYIFLKRTTDPWTIVYRLRSSDGTVMAVLKDTGRHIVGAGVSTCSPFGP